MKKVVALFLCATFIMLCMIGCGSNDKKNDDELAQTWQKPDYGIELKDDEKYKFVLASCVSKNYDVSEDKNYNEYTDAKFDDNGNLLELVKSDDDDGSKAESERYIFTYDNQNRPKTCKYILYNDGQAYEKNYTFVFNEKNRLTERVCDDIKLVLSYDEQDRIINATNYQVLDDGKLVLSLEKKYNYTDCGYSVVLLDENGNISEENYIYYTYQDGETEEKLTYGKYYNMNDPELASWEKTTYWDNGRIKNYEKYVDGQLDTESFYTEHNNETTYFYINGEKHVSKETIVEDENTEKTNEYEDGELVKSAEYIYNEKGDMIESTTTKYPDNYTVNAKIEYKYGQNGIVISKKEIYSDDNSIKTYTTEFDEEGRKTYQFSEEDGKIKTEYKYEYNNSKLVKVIFNGGEEIIDTYNYDEQGNYLGYVSVSQGKTYYKEILDSYGNLLYLKDDPNEVTYTYRAHIDDGRPDIMEIIEKIDDFYGYDF